MRCRASSSGSTGSKARAAAPTAAPAWASPSCAASSRRTAAPSRPARRRSADCGSRSRCRPWRIEPMSNVLVVEDEPKLASLVADYLKAAGYAAHCIENGLDAVPWVKANQPDLIVLDLMLPGRSGLEICKEVRSFSDLPIIMVTARVEEVDRLIGLEAGADDYLCKPFSVRELVARVKALLRRPRTAAAPSGLIIDEEKHQVSLDGKIVDLTPVEFRLLAALAAAPGK